MTVYSAEKWDPVSLKSDTVPDRRNALGEKLAMDTPSAVTAYVNCVPNGVSPKTAQTMSLKLLQSSYQNLHNELMTRLTAFLADPSKVLPNTASLRRAERRKPLQQSYAVKLKRTTTTTTVTTESIKLRSPVDQSLNHLGSVKFEHQTPTVICETRLPIALTHNHVPPTTKLNVTKPVTANVTKPVEQQPSRPNRPNTKTQRPKRIVPVERALPTPYTPTPGSWYLPTPLVRTEVSRGVYRLKPSLLNEFDKAESDLLQNKQPSFLIGSDSAKFLTGVRKFKAFVANLNDHQLQNPECYLSLYDTDFSPLSAHYKNTILRRKAYNLRT